MPNDRLWLEVSNVRTEGAETVQVQLKGDRSDKEPTWWEVTSADAAETAREIFRALDSKRIVLAGIGPAGAELVVHQIRIQFTDSGSR
jgi:hypothetical protein